jgi:hypothetical protein
MSQFDKIIPQKTGTALTRLGAEPKLVWRGAESGLARSKNRLGLGAWKDQNGTERCEHRINIQAVSVMLADQCLSLKYVDSSESS